MAPPLPPKDGFSAVSFGSIPFPKALVMSLKCALLVVSAAAVANAVGAAEPVWAQYFSQCLPSTSGPTPADINYWFSFGDSYTQTGFLPNETLPAVGNPLGNPPYPGYTAVGGTNWIDVDTTVYNTSTILTYNYAYGGATIDARLVAPYEPTVLSLTDQVNQFLSGAAAKTAAAPWTSEDTLFSFWIGINDIGNSYYESGSRDAFSDTLLDAYFALVQDVLYEARLTLMLAQDASAQALEKSVIDGFNSKLATRVSSFQSANPGVQTWVFDANSAFTVVLNDPQAYGFVDNTSFGNTGDFWGNNYHPSSAMQTIIGKQISQLLNTTVW
ncbi:hypothetical protein EUX98_g1717 [Antrodiella citrinella]|uniref:Carbohydrate esterase family 16 protein n=1 Tax=Antrodiella citrinella TaxID=2447956 RepID=A0A4V3XJC0_9APHY|nr:hypothetical protein EUX98_g1717 [Antrodiella citrinella]